MILIDISGTSAVIRKQDILTGGMVGQKVNFRFDEDWIGVAKTTVFRAGEVTKDAMVVDSASKIPHEVLIPGVALEIGVYGTKDDGDIVIPTVWAKTNLVKAGADPSGDEGTDPSLPFWAELQERLEKDLKGEKGDKGDKGDPGEDGKDGKDGEVVGGISEEKLVNVLKAELGDKEEIFTADIGYPVCEGEYIDSNNYFVPQEGCSVYSLTVHNQAEISGKTITIRSYMYGDMAIADDGSYQFCFETATNNEADISQNPESGIFDYEVTIPDETVEWKLIVSFCENPYLDKPEIIIRKGTVWEEIKKLQDASSKLNDYIFLQGKKDGWVFRQWASGIAEFWRKITGVTNEDGLMYIGYPFYTSDCVFTTGIPYASVHKVECSDAGTYMTLRYLYDDNTPFANTELSTFVSVKGRWADTIPDSEVVSFYEGEVENV